MTAKSLPITKGLPIVGSLPFFIRDPLRFARESRLTYGDIYILDLGLSRAIILNHPRHAQHVLRDNASNYHKGGAVWTFIRSAVGNGLGVSEGAFWLRQRRLMQPHFHHQRLAALTGVMVEAMGESFARWEADRRPGAPFDLAPAFKQLTMQVIFKTLFGTGLSASEMDHVAEAMGFASDFMLQAMVMDSLPRSLPFPGRKRFRDALSTFDEAVYRIIAQARQQKEPGNHLLAMMLHTADEETGESMDDRQLRDEVAALFLAGYETTSIALSWAVELLTLFPDTLRKLQAEVDAVLGSRPPTFADLPKLPYSRRVLQETLRIRPPSPFIPRTAIGDDEIDGYAIPAGSQLISLNYMYHLHPEFWPRPEAFDPERFTPQAAEGRHRFAWLPFGAGPRLCLGRDFSLLEGQLALVMLVQRYDLQRTSPRAAEPALSITLRPKHGVVVHLQPRTAAGG